jgi:hypothetical protein
MPVQLKKMAALMTDVMKKRNAHMPVVIQSGLAIPWPDELIVSIQENQP